MAFREHKYRLERPWNPHRSPTSEFATSVAVGSTPIGSALPTNLAVPASCGFEDAMAQQVKSGTSAHRALDRFQAADLSFHRAGTPRQRQARPDRRQNRPLPVFWCNRMLENNFLKEIIGDSMASCVAPGYRHWCPCGAASASCRRKPSRHGRTRRSGWRGTCRAG
jgi:hypothetical protein